MRVGGMQAEDARTPLADGTLVKTPSAPMPPRRSQPRLRGSPSPADTCRVTSQSGQPRLRGGPVSRPEGGFSTSCSHTPASTGVSTQRCRNSPLSLARRHRNHQSQP